MTMRRSPTTAPEIVTLATQDENDRIAMVIMQLEMALALAKLKGFAQLAANLESALDEARTLHGKLLN